MKTSLEKNTFVLLATLIAGTVLAPGSARAQGDAYARISFSAAQVYDGNLNAAPASRTQQADLISRIGAAVTGGYLSLPLKLVARYAIDAERYLSHIELNRKVARQDAGIELRYLPMHRLELSVDASYVGTQTPGEFNLESQLAVGRAHAERVSMGGAATYEWSRVSRITIDYTVARDALEGGVASATYSSRVGFDRRTGRRNTYRVDYRFRHVGFSDGAPEPSHLITGGWVHRITPLTNFEIEVGPYVSERTIRPELSALLRRRLGKGELSMGYSRTQATSIGERGTIDVHRVGASIMYRPVRHLTLTITPSFARSTREGRYASVGTMETQAILKIRHGLSLVASSRVGRQEGTFTGSHEEIPYRSLMMTLSVALPRQ